MVNDTTATASNSNNDKNQQRLYDDNDSWDHPTPPSLLPSLLSIPVARSLSRSLSLSPPLCFFFLVFACHPSPHRPETDRKHRTVEAIEGGTPGMVDDHQKMTDDFALFVEKMVL